MKASEQQREKLKDKEYLKSIEPELYTVKELAIKLDLSIKGVYQRIYTNKILPFTKKGTSNLYSFDKFKKPGFIKYYPLKTTETFYIYESKLNTMEL